MSFSLNSLYRFLGVSKQAVFQSKKRQEAFDLELADLVVQADILRSQHPGCGVAKMYQTLRPRFMGRDRFCEIFLDLGYRVRKLKNYVRTTVPSHISYPNLIEGMQVTRPYQVLQSDITYYDLNGTWYYIVFIIDVYTREILGYHISDHMRADANIKALKMALNKCPVHVLAFMVHHSDRGSQYGSEAYRKVLIDNGIQISMGLIAQDNAFAERINGTIKNEYLKRWSVPDFRTLQRKLKEAVEYYNTKSLHSAFKNKYAPLGFKKSLVDLNTQKRPKVIIYAEGNYKIKVAASHLDFNPEKEPRAHNCPIGYYEKLVDC